MRLCKDCKHYKPITFFVVLDAWCKVYHLSPSSKRSKIIDPVTGKTKREEGINQRCDFLRVGWDKNDCGPQGKYWEVSDE